jgi:replicative DNA helicase
MTDTETSRLVRVTGEVYNWRFRVDDSNPISVGEMMTRARKHQKRHGLDLIAIDYIQIIDHGRDDPRIGMNVVSEQLRRMVKEFDCPLIVLSQLTRESDKRTDKRPNLSDLKESGSIEAEADVVMAPYRPAYYQGDDLPVSESQDAELLLLKNRSGPLGKIDLRFIPDKTWFYDPEAERYGGTYD